VRTKRRTTLSIGGWGLAVAIGLTLGACASSSAGPGAAGTTTAPTAPTPPPSTVPPMAAAADLTTMAPGRLNVGDAYWYPKATITRCGGTSSECHVGDHTDLVLVIACDAGACTTHEAPGSSDQPTVALTNDGSGTWSATFPLVHDPFTCDHVPVPTTRTVRLTIASAQWMHYFGRFEASTLTGHVEDHAAAARGCEVLATDYDVTAQVK